MVHSLEPILREKRLENWMLLFLGVSGDTIHNVGFLQLYNFVRKKYLESVPDLESHIQPEFVDELPTRFQC